MHKLTQIDTDDRTYEVWLNLWHLVSMIRSQKWTHVTMLNGNNHYVVETPEEINMMYGE